MPYHDSITQMAAARYCCGSDVPGGRSHLSELRGAAIGSPSDPPRREEKTSKTHCPQSQHVSCVHLEGVPGSAAWCARQCARICRTVCAICPLSMSVREPHAGTQQVAEADVSPPSCMTRPENIVGTGRRTGRVLGMSRGL